MPDLDLDLKAEANVQDPYPVYAWLRRHDPAHWSESLEAWLVTRYDDVLGIFDRPELFSSDRFRKVARGSERPEVQAVARVLGEWLVFRDPPDHTRLRGLLQRSFTPRHLEQNRWGIQRTIDDLIDRVAAQGEMDFIRDFAFPLPAVVISVLLGVPRDDIEAVKEWSDQLAAYVGGSVEAKDNFTSAQAGVEQMVDYFRRQIAERGRKPRDDLMSLMLSAELAGDRLSSDEVVSNCVLLLFAGHETTTNLLGNGLHHLLRHPEQEAKLRATPELVASAVEEFLRYDGPVTATTKVATRDLELCGARLAQGDRVLAFMASANRDADAFEAPDVLDVERNPKRHLTFAYGIHFCLGAPLARMEAQLAFRSLLQRLPELSPGPARFKPQMILRGLRSLPLRWDARRAG